MKLNCVCWVVVLCMMGLVLCDTNSDDSYLAALRHTQQEVETLGRTTNFTLSMDFV